MPRRQHRRPLHRRRTAPPQRMGRSGRRRSWTPVLRRRRAAARAGAQQPPNRRCRDTMPRTRKGRRRAARRSEGRRTSRTGRRTGSRPEARDPKPDPRERRTRGADRRSRRSRPDARRRPAHPILASSYPSRMSVSSGPLRFDSTGPAHKGGWIRILRSNFPAPVRGIHCCPPRCVGIQKLTDFRSPCKCDVALITYTTEFRVPGSNIDDTRLSQIIVGATRYPAAYPQAHGSRPRAAYTFSAIAICWALVARSARSAYWPPPAPSQVP